ncbi:putative postmeiotic segregation increased 2-like protein 2 isoform X2 [Pan paniscus]|uniref:putative postmeiotic segregation increased 2-like protein 2 isoform X2 n=1 Tax=Pan paniscus TaxID=9597 RepID=UPI00155FCB28|nr:putative postmeiotic segregation increased 2-like protein 2 isoform X2 [Pan paniscus]
MSHVKCASFVFSFCHDCKFPEVSPAMLPEQPAERPSPKAQGHLCQQPAACISKTAEAGRQPAGRHLPWPEDMYP